MSGTVFIDEDQSEFGRYANWYDQLNTQKDYGAEIDYLLKYIKDYRTNFSSWLDVGCGTGRHLWYLKNQGLMVQGVDKSQKMVSVAREANPNIPFAVAGSHDFRLGVKFNVASMLFHVLSYHTTIECASQGVRNVARHLEPNGIFVFDFWHTEGVLADPPEIRTRIQDINGRRLFRTALPEEDRKNSLVKVNYEFRWEDIEEPVFHREIHELRHFTVEELKMILTKSGFSIQICEGWMTGSKITSKDWYGFILAIIDA